MANMPDNILKRLVCTSCRGDNIKYAENGALVCGACGIPYQVINNIPCFVSEENIYFSEVSLADRQKFLAAKRLAYGNDTFVGSLYNHYHKYAASRRKRLGADAITLDIGCGVGEHYPFITASEKSETRFIGLDTDRFKLEYCIGGHPELPLIQASAFHLPFSDASIDVVQLLATLEHFAADEAVAVLHEALRVLKPGGYLIACYPAEGSLLLRVGQFIMHTLIRLKTGFDLEREEVHHHCLTARGIKSMLLATPGLALRESIHFPLHIRNIHLSLFLNELYQKERV